MKDTPCSSRIPRVWQVSRQPETCQNHHSSPGSMTGKLDPDLWKILPILISLGSHSNHTYHIYIINRYIGISSIPSALKSGKLSRFCFEKIKRYPFYRHPIILSENGSELVHFQNASYSIGSMSFFCFPSRFPGLQVCPRNTFWQAKNSHKQKCWSPRIAPCRYFDILLAAPFCYFWASKLLRSAFLGAKERSLQQRLAEVGDFAPLKFNIPKNDSLEKVSPFKHGYFGYLP